MSRLRVMHVVVGGEIGGAERLLVELATRPEATGADHQVALVTPNRALAEFFVGAGLRVHERGPARESPLAYLRLSLGPAATEWLTRLIVDQGIDVVHSHTFGSHVLGTRAARRAGRPQIRTEHHVMHYFDASCSSFTRWAAARTQQFVAVSDYVRRVLVRTAPAVAERTRVVRNGVDTTYFQPMTSTEPRAGADGDSAGPFRAGILCRLTAWKRVHLAIDAAARTGIELVVVGDGEERGRLESMARDRRASVRFVGRQADPRPFVAACDAILSTSEDEPLGLSVLEALSMERPVVACAGGGIPEIVEDGVTGLLVREATGLALARALEQLRGDRERTRRMGQKGRLFAREHCSVDRMCAGYADVYADVADVNEVRRA